MINSSIIIFVLFLCAFCGFAVYDLATAKRRKEVYRAKTSITAYLMLLPSVALAFLFILLPILYSLGYAFTDYYLLRPNEINFVFLDNFAELFKLHFHQTPSRYITLQKLEYAKQLLATPHLSVMEISELCGFSDVYYFSKVFKAQTNQTPSAYRKECGQE